MTEASVVAGAGGALALRGVLDYRSGPQLREDGRELIRASAEQALVLDCSGVEKSSSVGLSLLLAFMRDANRAGKTLSIRGLPAEMHDIAQVSGLVELLPLQP
ncbi:STAS domain-containing protein [Pseudomonas sp. RIT-PI-AD]|uniref:STAS domain-containing protein n=1 Tax=Pseudomonas sp. RIT-PI-AD TaxID=3035294 RepID=UPI0021DA81B9|nr:STAS domain-containing protein [Pseudomonas sp. RIT-PI-AD]